MAKPPPADAAAHVEAAFRRLAILPGQEARLRTLIGRYVTLANCPPAGDRRPFNAVGERRTREELARLLAAAERLNPEDLAEATLGLHEPAVVALAAASIMRSDLVPDPTLPERIQKAMAQLPEIPDPPGGAPRDVFAITVARMIADDYAELTGQSPRIAGRAGGLVTLATTIFRIMGVNHNPRAAVNAALMLPSQRPSAVRKQ